MTYLMPRKDVELPPRMPEAAIIAKLRAECDGAHMIIATERAEVVRLRAENARLRSDAQAAVAMVVEKAVSAIRAEAKVSPYHNGMTVVYQRGLSDGFEAAAQIVDELTDKDGLSEVEALRKERDAVATARDMMGNLWADAKADLAAAQALRESLGGAKALAESARETLLQPVPQLATAAMLLNRIVSNADAALAALPAKEGE